MLLKPIVKGLNGVLNKNHNWFDYDAWDASRSPILSVVDNVTKKYAGTGLTDAEKEANAFSSDEAQKSRDFELFMARNKYQLETQSMEEAGINPAMVYGGGSLVSTATNGAAPSSVSPSGADLGDLFGLVTTLMRLPHEIDAIRASAERDRLEGAAASRNAESNAQNAASNSRNAGVNERNASVNERRVEIEGELAKSSIELNDEQKKRLAADTLYIQEQTNQLPERLAIAKKNADSQEKSAIASLQSAMAAVQNAATNDRLADYQTDLMYAQAYVEWANHEGKSIMNRYLDAKEQQTLENLGKQGKLYDVQKGFLTSQMITNYVNSACNVSNAVNRWINPLSGMSKDAPMSNPTPISPDMLYGNFGTFYGD